MYTHRGKKKCLQQLGWEIFRKKKTVSRIFAEYNQQDAILHNLFISVGRSTCFRRVFRPLSGAAASLARPG